MDANKMKSERIPSNDEIEALFVNNADFAKLAAMLNRFNPIRTMGMEHMEIRHSAILAWLLDPGETHGLGEAFLIAFLSEAFRGQENGEYSIALEIARSDMRDVQVRREWQNIDIFLVSEQNASAYVIENKFYSSQREGQLSDYMDRVRSTYSSSGLNIRGVFLTLFDEEPEDTNFATLKYSNVLEILQQITSSDEQKLSNEVIVFIGHYMDILQEATGMSENKTKLEALARTLYLENKKVLDFVIEHGASTDFAVAARSIFGEDSEYGAIVDIEGREFVFSGLANQVVSFLPQSWYDAFGQQKYYWEGCNDWWAGYPLIAWLQASEHGDSGGGQIRLYAEVGPVSNHEFRSALISAIQKIAEEQDLDRIKFQQRALSEGAKYSKLLKKNSRVVKDMSDADEIAKQMASLLKSFRAEIDAVAGVLPHFKRFGIRT